MGEYKLTCACGKCKLHKKNLIEEVKKSKSLMNLQKLKMIEAIENVYKEEEE